MSIEYYYEVAERTVYDIQRVQCVTSGITSNWGPPKTIATVPDKATAENIAKMFNNCAGREEPRLIEDIQRCNRQRHRGQFLR